VDTLGRALCSVLVSTYLTVDDHDLIRGASLVSRCEHDDERKDDNRHGNNDRGYGGGNSASRKKSAEICHCFFLSYIEKILSRFIF
jgi:hypothetical protein